MLCSLMFDGGLLGELIAACVALCVSLRQRTHFKDFSVLSELDRDYIYVCMHVYSCVCMCIHVYTGST